MKAIILDFGLFQNKIFYIVDKKLEDLSIENADNALKEEDIVKGRIMNNVKGIKASFVDIGENKNAFFPYQGNALHLMQDYIFQIKKVPIADKGYLLTNKIQYANDYLVLIENDSGIFISKKIKAKDENDRLKNLFEKVLPKGYALIVRTKSAFEKDDILRKRLEKLIEKSNKIKEKAKYSKAPKTLLRAKNNNEKMFLELLKDKIDYIYTNDLERLKALSEEYFDGIEIKEKYPNFEYYLKNSEEKIKIYTDDDKDFLMPIDTEKSIRKLCEKKVWLKSGGFLIIEPTEALWSIDVNTGRFTGKKNQEKTKFKTNQEAILASYGEIKLRNISGIIIIDFINMQEEENYILLENLLKKEMKNDKVFVKYKMDSDLGLFIITRQRKSSSIYNILKKNCKECNTMYKEDNNFSKIDKLEKKIANLSKQQKERRYEINCSEHLKGFIDKLRAKDKLEEKYNINLKFILR